MITLAIGLSLLITGSFFYQFQDWDVGISLIMGIMAYLFAPCSVRALIVRQWRKLPLILFLCWLTVEGVYVGYNELLGHWYVREANFWASTTPYSLCGVIWMPTGPLRELRLTPSDGCK